METTWINSDQKTTNSKIGLNTILDVSHLTMRFGGIIALNDVNFQVKENSITSLIGPNGAGKTTVFNCVTGFYLAKEGNIIFRSENKDINLKQLLGEPFNLKDFLSLSDFVVKLTYNMFGGTHLIVRNGIARTFQNIRLFKEMTVLENLLVAQHVKINKNLLSGCFKLSSFKKSENDAVDKSYFWLKKMGLEDDAQRLAGEMPYGKARLLEIARAMCTDPKMICLDEPAAGLNPKETSSLSENILKLRDESKVTVLLIEHDMGMVMEVSEHIVVLDHGQVIAEGAPSDIQSNPKVIEAYLGSEAVEEYE